MSGATIPPASSSGQERCYRPLECICPEPPHTIEGETCEHWGPVPGLTSPSSGQAPIPSKAAVGAQKIAARAIYGLNSLIDRNTHRISVDHLQSIERALSNDILIALTRAIDHPAGEAAQGSDSLFERVPHEVIAARLGVSISNVARLEEWTGYLYRQLSSAPQPPKSNSGGK